MSAPARCDGSEMTALLAAASRVRDGRWIRGAPTHVLADLMTELERSGWRLVRDAPVCGALISATVVCDEPQWDGPYRMSCGRAIANGACPVHGEDAAVRLPSPFDRDGLHELLTGVAHHLRNLPGTRETDDIRWAERLEQAAARLASSKAGKET